MKPMSYIFQQGHRIRVTLTGADDYRSDEPSLAPVMSVLRDRQHPSYITFPVVPGGE